jgi:hypothetical protein
LVEIEFLFLKEIPVIIVSDLEFGGTFLMVLVTSLKNHQSSIIFSNWKSGDPGLDTFKVISSEGLISVQPRLSVPSPIGLLGWGTET